MPVLSIFYREENIGNSEFVLTVTVAMYNVNRATRQQRLVNTAAFMDKIPCERTIDGQLSLV